jgi:hypothetical protein
MNDEEARRELERLLKLQKEMEKKLAQMEEENRKDQDRLDILHRKMREEEARLKALDENSSKTREKYKRVAIHPASSLDKLLGRSTPIQEVGLIEMSTGGGYWSVYWGKGSDSVPVHWAGTMDKVLGRAQSVAFEDNHMRDSIPN